MPPSARSSERQRVRNLLALDAQELMRRLDERVEAMVAIFSQRRERDALLAPLQSCFATVRFGDLALLAPGEQDAVLRFHAEREALEWYCRWTEDMPGTVRQRLQLHARKLGELHAALRDALGPPGAARPRPARRRAGAAQRKGR